MSWFFSIGALLCFALSVLSIFVPMSWFPRLGNLISKQRVVYVIIFLFLSTFFTHSFVLVADGYTVREFANSWLMAFRTFLVEGDVDFAVLIPALEQTASQQLPAAVGAVMLMPLKAVAYGCGVVAPLMLVTAVLSLISQFIPRCRIRFSPLREKFVFSEVSEETVTLAESIYRETHKRWQLFAPLLIFTDVYPDERDEKRSEWMVRLLHLGCACVKDDILSLRVTSRKRVTYILAERREERNLSIAFAMVKRWYGEEPNGLRQRNSVYVFNGMDEAQELLGEKCRELALRVNRLNESRREKGHKAVYRMPYIIPIKEYKNIVYKLLEDAPLFLPLRNKQEKKDVLNVTLLGTGRIGMEAFLASFWCGQLLDCRLHLTVASLDACAAFQEKVKRISPDIFGSAEKPLPYAGFAMVGCNLQRINFDEFFNQKIEAHVFDGEYGVEIFGEDYCAYLHETDYFIVALGNDELNIKTAHRLRQAIARRSTLLAEGERHQVVIAAAVYDSSLAEALAFEDEMVRIVPFATLKSRYSYDNVINKTFTEGAQRLSGAYQKGKAGYSERDMTALYGEIRRNSSGVEETEHRSYQYWANIARRLHEQYMLAAAGVYPAKNGTYENRENLSYDEMTAEADKRLLPFVEAIRDDDFCDRLAWLEHRRWNAHLWTMGYRCTESEKELMTRKEHPCLVEIQPGRHHRLPFAVVTEEGKVCCRGTLKAETLAAPPYDDLDRAGYFRGETAIKTCDTKVYDYPQFSGLRLDDRLMRAYLRLDEATDYYSSRVNADAYCYELYSVDNEQAVWRWQIHRYLLDDTLKEALERAGADFQRRKELLLDHREPTHPNDADGMAERERKRQSYLTWEEMKALLG